MRHVGPSNEDIAFLASTTIKPWDMAWLAAGRITDEKSPSPGVYEVSQITFGREARLWIGAKAYDVPIPSPNDEVFGIEVGYDEQFGDPAKEVRWRPRRTDLHVKPADLNIEPFIAPGRRYSLVRKTVRAGDENVSVDEGLLVTSRSGEQLLFFADQTGMPLDMFVTSDPDEIRKYLGSATQILPIDA